MAAVGLSEWLASPLGRHVLAWEMGKLDSLLSDVFGFNAVQLGLPEIDLLRANRMPFRFVCARDGGAVRADFHELPFVTHSLDLVLLPHVLEFDANPHQILREVERVLVPEGSAVVVGFNPLSLWGMRRLLCKKAEPPWAGRYLSPAKLRDWFALLGFEIRAGVFGCYLPPVKSEKWIRRYRFFEAAGDRWWAIFGAVYILHAIKRQPGMRLVQPKWRERMARARALALLPQKQIAQKQDERRG